MGKEGVLIKQIQLSLNRAMRLFRNNTGMGWAGSVVSRTSNSIHMQDPRPLRAGLVQGSSDLVGWTSVEITPEMVGKKAAIFTAIEAKTGRGKATKAQKLFLEAVITSGGIAGIARTPEDVNRIFTEWQMQGDE